MDKRGCSFTGCQRRHYGRGWCNMHWQRWRQHDNPVTVKVGGFKPQHGETGTRLHGIWMGMLQRCNSPNCNIYKNYGKRGIKVCDGWLKYANFRDWSLKNGYQGNLTLDRRDNDGDYTPENCRWATYEEQQNNRRNNRLITAKGVTKTLAQWSKQRGLKSVTVAARIDKHKWSTERALEL